MLVAIGVRKGHGRRTVLGCSVARSEAEIHWRKFFNSITTRGIGLPRMITSDAHEGLKAALSACFPGVPWQRCQFHLRRNPQAYVPKVEMKPVVTTAIRRVFKASDRREADNRGADALKIYGESAPTLEDWMEENLNKKIGRRTRVCGLFPNEASLLRLATAILMEQSNEWETGKAYLKND